MFYTPDQSVNWKIVNQCNKHLHFIWNERKGGRTFHFIDTFRTKLNLHLVKGGFFIRLIVIYLLTVFLSKRYLAMQSVCEIDRDNSIDSRVSLCQR